MEFYIWSEGGAADDILEAVIRAARRGVQCLLLIDGLGARPWWKGTQPQRLRDAGVQLVPRFPRASAHPDRAHRSPPAPQDRGDRRRGRMDGQHEPRRSALLQAGLGVGEWVDAMARFEGTVVNPLAGVLIGDWTLETGEPAAQADRRCRPWKGTAHGDGECPGCSIGSGPVGGRPFADDPGVDQLGSR